MSENSAKLSFSLSNGGESVCSCLNNTRKACRNSVIVGMGGEERSTLGMFGKEGQDFETKRRTKATDRSNFGSREKRVGSKTLIGGMGGGG